MKKKKQKQKQNKSDSFEHFQDTRKEQFYERRSSQL